LQQKQLIQFFDNSRKPDFAEFAKHWSLHCGISKKIFYKIASKFEVLFQKAEYRNNN
jgi:hypothetical protein